MASKELENLLGNLERYRGKHVVAVEDEIAIVEGENELRETIERFEEKYPRKTPLITFVPEEGVLIL
ncbi:MAG: hypothetical protein COS88_04630 [Chloroflexi bacterium CG07_land_8_20_14_0_80_51_10]|nr:MAG: hypothetical protein COS88_04630 [Chloroflexi bacterium CG07_land_8_20_14_0_80_51_10]